MNLALNTGFNVGVSWTPTRRITVALKSDNMWSDIDEAPGGTALAPTGGKRKDLLRSYSRERGLPDLASTCPSAAMSRDAYAVRKSGSSSSTAPSPA